MTSPNTVSSWKCALELRPDRSVSGGSLAGLCAAIRCGADLRVYTEFHHEEHIAPYSQGAARDPHNRGIVREVIDFRETLLIHDRHAAGITTLRQPLEPPTGLNGKQPRMSFFMYNMDGHQSCASLLLDSTPPSAVVGTRAILPAKPDIPKMSAEEVFDTGTMAPSRNFIWDMEVYRFWVRDDWLEILAHDSDGRVTFGSFESLEHAQIQGREIKAGIRNLCADLGAGPPHEVFSFLGSGFIHTGPKLYSTLTHPLVRVAPSVPLRYASRNWDLSWVFLRTDGFAILRTLDPYTRTFRDRETRLACRWFAR